MPRFHVLGSAGWVPTLNTQTCCYLLETRRGLVFFDCGSGISRLMDPMLQEVVRRNRRSIILLSHWHHDHVEGLHMLPFFLAEHEVILAAPSAAICGHEPEAVLGRFGGAPLLALPLPRWEGRFRGGFKIQSLDAGSNKVGGEQVEVIVQPHGEPSLGFRVRDVAYVTDTCVRQETAAFASKAALLVHDAWLDRQGALEHPDQALVHGTAEGAARIALESCAQELILAHLNPNYDLARRERLLLEAAAVFPRAQLASDMTSLRIGEADDAAESNDPATSV